MHNVESMCCNTSSSLRSSPEELLHVPIKLLAVECAGIAVLIVVKVIMGIVKLNHAWLGHSVAAVGRA